MFDYELLGFSVGKIQSYIAADCHAKEPVLLSLSAHGMSVTSLYLELRALPTGYGALYYVVAGRFREASSLLSAIFLWGKAEGLSGWEEAREQFDYEQHIMRESIPQDDFRRIRSLLEALPLCDMKYFHGGKDGHYVIFRNHLGGQARYKFWCYAPPEHGQLNDILTILSKYLPKPYGMHMAMDRKDLH